MHELGDVLQLLLPAILRSDIEFATYLVIGRTGQANTTRLGNPFEPRSHIDTIAHEVAIVLHDHVTKIDADAELDAPVLYEARVALSHDLLHIDGRTNCIHDRGELGQQAIPSRFDDTPAMGGDHRIDEILADGPEAIERAFLVNSHCSRLHRPPGLSSAVGLAARSPKLSPGLFGASLRIWVQVPRESTMRIAVEMSVDRPSRRLAHRSDMSGARGRAEVVPSPGPTAAFDPMQKSSTRPDKRRPCFGMT